MGMIDFLNKYKELTGAQMLDLIQEKYEHKKSNFLNKVLDKVLHEGYGCEHTYIYARLLVGNYIIFDTIQIMDSSVYENSVVYKENCEIDADYFYKVYSDRFKYKILDKSVFKEIIKNIGICK